MIRKEGVSKHDAAIDPENPWTHFREATWEEALDRAAGGLARIRDQHGGNALAGFGSAKGSNEEAYLFQKLVRAGFGTNNVDHCTRLCHASSVAGLLEGVGSGAVSAPFMAVEDADVIVVIGANPTENHPGRRNLLQAGGRARGEAHRHGPARHDPDGARDPHAAVQAGPRRSDAQRHPQRHRRRRALRPAIRAGEHRRFRQARRERQGLCAGGDGAKSAAFRPRCCARSRACTPAPKRRSSSGAWASASTSTAPTTPAA